MPPTASPKSTTSFHIAVAATSRSRHGMRAPAGAHSGRSRAITQMTATNRSASTTPGIMPAANSAGTDSSAASA